jgi:hypothetical protein
MRILAILCFILAFISCKTIKYSADKLPEKQLIFGSEGGFTGFGSEFILCENGQIFKRSIASNLTEEIKISKKSEVKKLFKFAFEQSWINKEYQNPGNFSSFILFKDKYTQHKFIWSNTDTLINPAIKSLAMDAKKIITKNADK